MPNGGSILRRMPDVWGNGIVLMSLRHWRIDGFTVHVHPGSTLAKVLLKNRNDASITGRFDVHQNVSSAADRLHHRRQELFDADDVSAAMFRRNPQEPRSMAMQFSHLGVIRYPGLNLSAKLKKLPSLPIVFDPRRSLVTVSLTGLSL